jgi:hypothetical protein
MTLPVLVVKIHQVRDTVGLTDATTQQVEVTTTPQVFLPLISK